MKIPRGGTITLTGTRNNAWGRWPDAEYLKIAFEKRIGARISADRAVVTWMVEYVGAMITRFKIGEDGLTPYERLKGRIFRKPVVDFGEFVMAEVHRTTGGKLGKLEDRFV